MNGLDGLAMLLVDVDYDGKIFDMGRTVFAKDIGDESKIRMTGLTESLAVIAIDKHGNESKPFIQVFRLKVARQGAFYAPSPVYVFIECMNDKTP